MIHAEGLRKSYPAKGGAVHALNGLDLTVPQGTVKAVLGPNGAGKTTTVKVLTTLVRPDQGTVRIDGIDVLADPRATKRVIGVSGQYAAVDENLTGLENLEMIGHLSHLGRKTARVRSRELIDMFDLAEAGERPVKGFSGGMRRRIDLAGALVTRPKVLFLDEPTTGLDPRSRLGLWAVIKGLVAEGTTVLLTTQYLEEADQLADSISVVDEGRVIAEGTPDDLKAQVGGHRVVVTLAHPADADVAARVLRRFGEIEVESAETRTLEVAVTDGASALAQVLLQFEERLIGVVDAGMRRPTLDDVFLRLTGRARPDDEEQRETATTEVKA